MSLSGSSDSRCRSWATIRLAISSVTGGAEEDDPLVEQARVDVERSARRARSARPPSGPEGSWPALYRRRQACSPSPSRVRGPEAARRPRAPSPESRSARGPRPAPARSASPTSATSSIALRAADVLDDHRVAAVLAQPLQQLLGGVVRSCSAVCSSASISSSSADLDPLGLGDRGQHRLALQLALGVGLGLLDQLLAGLALHLQEGVGVHPARRELAFDPLPAFRRPGRSTSSSGTLDRRVVDGGVDRGDPEVLLGPAARPPRRPARGCRRAAPRACRTRRPRRRSRRRARAATFSRTSLTSTVEDGVFAGQVLGLVVVGEGDLDLALLAGLGAGELLLEALDQPAGAELEQVVGGRAALEGAAVDRAPRSRSAARRRRRPARSTGSSRAKPSRIRSTSRSTMSSGTSGSARPTSRPLYSPSSAVGRTPTSNLKLERLALRLGGRDDLDAGIADRADRRSRAAPVRTTRAATRGSPPRAPAPKPSRWITSEGGALPLRKPGSRISRARLRAARWHARSTSSAGTSTSTRTRESGSSVTVSASGARP